MGAGGSLQQAAVLCRGMWVTRSRRVVAVYVRIIFGWTVEVRKGERFVAVWRGGQIYDRDPLCCCGSGQVVRRA